MGNPKNLIELNGKKYDTVTGQVLGSGSAHHPKKPSTPAHNAHSGASVEGFVAPRPHKVRPAAPTAKGIHHKTTKAKTLMRGAVRRPAITAIQGTVEHIAQLQRNTHVIADHKRAQRAKKVSKSNLVSRFGSGTVSGNLNGTLGPKKAVLPVKPAPIAAASSPLPAAAAVGAQPAASRVAHKAPKPKQSFVKELEKADSHTQPKAPKRKLNHRIAKKLRVKPRVLNIAASAAVVLLLTGFFGYQYRAYAAVRLAAVRSGVKAAVPAAPSGFALSEKVQYKPGEVSLDYRSNSDQRNFTVTQSKSAWNSEALEENFVSQLPAPHSSTLYPNGKTVYTYGEEGSNATWVSGGVWYKVEGQSALTSTQLQNIINSL